MPNEPAYTAEDLVRDAASQGIPVKQRLITDWVEKGLLDRPTRHSLGRGRGSAPATWPENQRKLFLLLLGKRQEVSRLATLCNVPVALWLYFGPEQVPSRQVRRALATYGGAYRTGSARAARQTARLVGSHLLPADLSRRERTRLMENLTIELEKTTGGGPPNFEPLLAAAREAFDPRDAGRTVGPLGARLTPEAWVRVIDARLAALDLLDLDDDQPSDARLEDARLARHQHLAEYIRRQPEFARDPNIGALFATPTFEYLVNNACLDLLTVLGMLELARQPANPPMPT